MSVITPTSHCRTTLTLLCDLKSSSSRFERSTTAKSLSPPPRRCCCCCGGRKNNNALLLLSSSLSRKDSDAFVNQNRLLQTSRIIRNGIIFDPESRVTTFCVGPLIIALRGVRATDDGRTDGRTASRKSQHQRSKIGRERERSAILLLPRRKRWSVSS